MRPGSPRIPAASGRGVSGLAQRPELGPGAAATPAPLRHRGWGRGAPADAQRAGQVLTVQERARAAPDSRGPRAPGPLGAASPGDGRERGGCPAPSPAALGPAGLGHTGLGRIGWHTTCLTDLAQCLTGCWVRAHSTWQASSPTDTHWRKWWMRWSRRQQGSSPWADAVKRRHMVC